MDEEYGEVASNSALAIACWRGRLEPGTESEAGSRPFCAGV